MAYGSSGGVVVFTKNYSDGCSHCNGTDGGLGKDVIVLIFMHHCAWGQVSR